MFKTRRFRFMERFQGSFIFHYCRLPLLTHKIYENRKFLRKRSLTSLHPSLTNRNEVYRYFENQFRFNSSQFLWKHNWYFKQDARGFGEPAFHAAWHQIFEELRPEKCLEIGVYRGQTITLWTLLSEKLGFNCDIYGITPLTAKGDSVSQYVDIDFATDIQLNFDKFKLKHAKIIHQLSTTEKSCEFISNGNWDLIYIDGSHEYEDVLSDYLNSVSGIAPNGLIVMDDSSLFMDSIENYGAFQGHPGPSKICVEYAKIQLDHVLSVGHLNFFRRK